MTPQIHSELVNITTLQYLAQLQAKVPNILELQIGTYRDRLSSYLFELQDLADAHNFEASADCLHKLSGYSSMLGFVMMQKLCAEYEDEYLGRVRGFYFPDDNVSLKVKRLQECFDETWQVAVKIIPALASSNIHDVL